MVLSAIVELAAHAGEAQFGDPVRTASFGGDQAPVLQFSEDVFRKAGVIPSVAGDTVHFFQSAVVVAAQFNAAALCQHMQNALFSFRNIH